MSRIEEALAKAAEMRGGQSDGMPPRDISGDRETFSRECQTDVLENIGQEPLLVSANSPCSLEAEEFRKLKEGVVKKTKRGTFKNMIMVTSGTVGEGKSLTAVNLALSLALEFDHTVLLVDADLRKPSCHELMGLEPKLGLSECLTEGRDVSEAFLKVGVGKLVFLPGGKAISNPGELVSSNLMKSVFQEMKQRYSDRYVIIDTSPVLPFAETRSMSRYVDCAVLVVKEGGISQSEVLETIDALKSTDLLGLVYNQARRPCFSGRYASYPYSYGA